MIKLLKKLTKKDWLFVFISVLLIVFQVWLELKMPDYMSNITQLVQTKGADMKDILKEGSYMLLCALGSLLSAGIVGYFISGIAASFSFNVREAIFKKVLNLDTSEIKNFSTSSLITRTTNDITQVEMLIGMGLQLMIKAPITAAWAITKILGKSLEWSMATAVAVIILITTIIILMIIVMPRFKIVQNLIDKINSVTRENLTGIRVVRAFNAEKYQEDKFNKVNNDLTNTQMFNQKTFNILGPMMNIVMHTLTLSIYFIGALLIDKALMGDKIVLFGDMIVFSSYAMQVIMSFLMLAMIFMMLPRANVSAKRINEVLDTEVTIEDGKVTKNKNGLRGTVEFKNVSFKYPDADEYILENISFTANEGDTVAFIGSTGSGKSTLINLIPRFYDATDGEILVNGINVKDYKEEYLHNIVGYVPQKAVMFSGTVESNITYGKSILGKPEKKKINEALKVSQAYEFVSKLDKKEKSHIAQGGTNVSGGQKQRLSIARTLSKGSKIILFDEATSALDNKSQEYIKKTIDNLVKDHTIVIVAHRLSTIIDADIIFVVDDGKVVSSGTHNELLKTSDIYKNLYETESLNS